jgi:hypothetical protein
MVDCGGWARVVFFAQLSVDLRTWLLKSCFQGLRRFVGN